MEFRGGLFRLWAGCAPRGERDMASWWDRHGVPRLIRCACSQGQIMKARSELVPLATGDVLELGCGGGINMEFYAPDRVTGLSGLDPSPELLAMSRAAAQARGIDADIRGGVGEAMPFDSGRFDTVVTTFTLCSVADQAAVLAEIRRSEEHTSELQSLM